MKKYRYSLKKSLTLNLIIGLSALLLIMSLWSCNSTLKAAPPNPIVLNGLYVHTYGSYGDQPVIFIHGGPAGDSMFFEYGAGRQLAFQNYDKNHHFFVIVYDQRGQGRSDDAKHLSDYSYKQYSDDINLIIRHFNLTAKPILLGHGHGGTIALKYDEMNPGVAQKIVLINSAHDTFQSFTTISNNCQNRYNKTGEVSKISELKSSLETMAKNEASHDELLNSTQKILEKARVCGDPDASMFTHIEKEIPASILSKAAQFGDAGELYRSKIFADATKYGEVGGIYSPHARSHATDPSVKDFDTDVVLGSALKYYQMVGWLRMPISEKNQKLPVAAFLNNEKYIHLNTGQYVSQHNDHIVGIYGADDGTFDQASLDQIKIALGADAHPERMVVLTGASHNAFIDQGSYVDKAGVHSGAFMDALTGLISAK